MGNCNCIKTKSINGLEEINENLSPDQMLSIDYATFKEDLLKRNMVFEPIDEELIHLCYKSKNKNNYDKNKRPEPYDSCHSMQEIIF